MSQQSKSIQERAADYYRGERICNALLFLIGGAAITWTLILFLWRHGQFSSGLFFSAFPLGCFFVITGGYRFWRSFKRFGQIKESISGVSFLYKEERLHLEGRYLRFLRKRKVDSIGILVGFVLLATSDVFYFSSDEDYESIKN